MYFIKGKNGKPKATSDPDEVTKENFLVEPGAENKVWCKLEQWGHGEEPGTKVHVVNQVRADNPGDFERFVHQWKKQGMTITMLHDPRGKDQNGVAAKLAKLNEQMAAKDGTGKNAGEMHETPADEPKGDAGETKGKTK